MDNALPERTRQGREPLPNLRGEDETELAYLISLIETQAWILFPSKHSTCVIGRHPPPTEEKDADKDGPKFIASLYSMGKGGIKCLGFGPMKGQTRKDALSKLLRLVEVKIGKMMMADREEMKESERDREGGGRSWSGGNGVGSGN